MAKKLHYEVNTVNFNGRIPDETSPVYTGQPLTFTRSAKISAIYIDDVTGQRSEIVHSYVKVVPPELRQRGKKLLMNHLMVELGGFAQDANAWVAAQKAQGFNCFWFHCELYGTKPSDGAAWNNYTVAMERLMDACDANDVFFVPGIAYSGDMDQKLYMIDRTWNRKSILKIDGKRVYCDYSSEPYIYQHLLDNLLTMKEITRDQIMFLHHTLYPSNSGGLDSDFNGDTPAGEVPFIRFSGSVGIGNEDEMEHVFDCRNTIFDGTQMFTTPACGDNTNELNRKTALRMGKIPMSGFYFFFASNTAGVVDWEGAHRCFMELLAPLPEDRSMVMCITTANDHQESSHVSPLAYPSTKDGCSYYPPLAPGAYPGDKRLVIWEHTGIMEFLKPYTKAYLNDELDITVEQERIFYRYPLHVSYVPQITKIPWTLLNVGSYNPNDTTWQNTANYNPYRTSNTNEYINNYVQNDTISIGVHITSPCRLRINETVSEVKTGKIAWFKIPIADFRGTPRFAILNLDGTVRKQCWGKQPITNSSWPGCWGQIILEGNPNLPTPSAPVVVYDGVDKLYCNHPNFAQSELEYNIGFSRWQPYTGPLYVGPSYADYGFIRFRVKETSSRNEGIVTESPELTGPKEYSQSINSTPIGWRNYSPGCTVDTDGGLKLDMSVANQGGTLDTPFGPAGTYVQYIIKGSHKVVFSSSDSISDIASKPYSIFFGYSYGGLYRPDGSRIGDFPEPLHNSWYGGGPVMIRYTVMPNKKDLLIQRSLSGGKRFLDEGVIATDVLDGSGNLKWVQLLKGSDDGSDLSKLGVSPAKGTI